jgi:hypothetical protein
MHSQRISKARLTGERDAQTARMATSVAAAMARNP